MWLRLCDIKSGAGKILGWGIRGLRLKLEGMDGFGMGLECVSLPFWAGWRELFWIKLVKCLENPWEGTGAVDTAWFNLCGWEYRCLNAPTRNFQEFSSPMCHLMSFFLVVSEYNYITQKYLRIRIIGGGTKLQQFSSGRDKLVLPNVVGVGLHLSKQSSVFCLSWNNPSNIYRLGWRRKCKIQICMD